MVAETGHDPNTQQNLMTKHPFFGNFIQPAFIYNTPYCNRTFSSIYLSAKPYLDNCFRKKRDKIDRKAKQQ